MSDFFMLIVNIEAFMGDTNRCDLAVKEENGKVVFGRHRGDKIIDPFVLCDINPNANLCEDLYQALINYFGDLFQPMAVYTPDGWSFYLTCENISVLFPKDTQWIKNKISQDEERKNGSR